MRLYTAAALAAVCVAGLVAQQPQTPLPQGLKVGDVAPNFTLNGTDGKKYSLADYKGKNVVVLAFFPAAFTGG